MWLGIFGVYVDSSIVDEGALVKTSPLQGWGVIHASLSPLHHSWCLVSRTIKNHVVLYVYGSQFSPQKGQIGCLDTT